VKRSAAPSSGGRTARPVRSLLPLPWARRCRIARLAERLLKGLGAGETGNFRERGEGRPRAARRRGGAISMFALRG
jgi:hypothetical protein